MRKKSRGRFSDDAAGGRLAEIGAGRVPADIAGEFLNGLLSKLTSAAMALAALLDAIEESAGVAHVAFGGVAGDYDDAASSLEDAAANMRTCLLEAGAAIDELRASGVSL